MQPHNNYSAMNLIARFTDKVARLCRPIAGPASTWSAALSWQIDSRHSPLGELTSCGSSIRTIGDINERWPGRGVFFAFGGSLCCTALTVQAKVHTNIMKIVAPNTVKPSVIKTYLICQHGEMLSQNKKNAISLELGFLSSFESKNENHNINQLKGETVPPTGSRFNKA